MFKASRGSRTSTSSPTFARTGAAPAVVSVTALRDAQDAIIGYLLIGTDNTARKLVEAEQNSSISGCETSSSTRAR